MAQLADYYDEKVSPEWNPLRAWFMEVLQKEAELQEIVQLVGSDALPENEQITIEVARMIRELFLQQNGFDPVDTYCDLDKQLARRQRPPTGWTSKSNVVSRLQPP